MPAATATEAIEGGAGAGGVTGVAAVAAAPAGLLAVELVEADGDDPQPPELPNAKPAITHGVVSELTWMLLPGGCVIAIVALEEAVETGFAAAEGLELAALPVLAPPPEGVPDVVEVGLALGVAPPDDDDPDEPPGLAVELEPAAVEDVGEEEASPEKAEATSEDDK